MSGSLDFTNQYIQETYKRVVQTQDGFLYDGTGSLINNVSIPGDLHVSGTLYAQNTVTVTQSYYSGSNIFGDELTDTHQFTGSVLITGSLTTAGPTVTTGSITIQQPADSQGLTIKGYDDVSSTSTSLNIDNFGQFQFSTNAVVTRLNTAAAIWTGTSYIKINPAGGNYLSLAGNSTSKVSVGKDAPSAKFEIRGSGTSSSTTALRVENINASASMVVLDDGNVGIGTDALATDKTLTVQMASDTGGIRVWRANRVQGIDIGYGIISSLNQPLTFNAGTKGFLFKSDDLSFTSGDLLTIQHSNAARQLKSSNSQQAGVNIQPNIGQSGTANYVGLNVAVTTSTTGSGQNYLANFSLDGTSRFYVTDQGSGNFADGLIVTGSLTVSGSARIVGDKTLHFVESGDSYNSKIFGTPSNLTVQGKDSNFIKFSFNDTTFDNTGAFVFKRASSQTHLKIGALQQKYFDFSGGDLGRTSGGIGYGVYQTSGLRATANNDILIGYYLDPQLNEQTYTGTTKYSFYNASPYNTFFSGSVGIRTTTPSYTLDVSGSGNFTGGLTVTGSGDIVQAAGANPFIRIEDTSAASRSQLYGGLEIYDSTGALGSYFKHVSSANLEIRSTAGDVSIGTFADGGLIYLDGDKVGISTSSPAAKLHVKGSGTSPSSTALLVQNANASASLAVNDAGNVLIGTTTDAGYKLDVNGSVRLTNNLTTSSYFRTNGIASDGRMALYGTDTNGSIQLLAHRGNFAGGAATLFPGVVSTAGITGAIGFQGSQLAIQSHVIGIGVTNGGTHKSLAIGTPNTSVNNGFGGNADTIDIGTFSSVSNTWGGTRPSITYTALAHNFKVNNGTGQNNPGTSALYIDSGSNVGIGTTSPAYKLDVSGSARFTDGITISGSTTINGNVTIYGTASVDVLITNYESSSIIYSSGSTKFGDTMDDTHEFTGSLYVTGSVNLGVGDSTTQAVSVIRATETNSGIAIVPNGTGAITANIPDGTATGGDARGSGAIDLQMSRQNSNQVASGIKSAILGGFRNQASGQYSLAFGDGNVASDVGAIAIGLSNNATARGAVAIGGYNVGNDATGTGATIIGGELNTASNNYSIVVGGYQNTASGQYSIAGGQSNTASGLGAVALGRSNVASGTGAIAIGTSNTVTYQLGFAGGNGNTVSVKGTAFGGSNTVAGGEWSAAIGSSNSITSTGNSYVIGDRISSTATYAFGTGNNSRAYLTGQRVHASGWFVLNNGDQQISDLIASKLDTLSTAATTTLTLWDGSLIIPTGNNRIWNVVVNTTAVVTSITGTATGVSVGDVYSENTRLTFKKISGVSSLVGILGTEKAYDTSMTTAQMNFSAGASQELALDFQAPTFSGGGSITVRVVSKVQLVEVAY